MRRPILATLFAAGMLAVGTPARGATITMTTSTAADELTAEIGIQGVTDLFTFSFDLSFDANVVSPIGLDQGTFPGCCPFAILPDDAGGLPGTIQFISDTLLGPVPPATGVSGDFVLAFLLFLTLGDGDPAFAVSNVVLLDSAGGLIEPELPTSVPEPSALALLALGFVALRRRTRLR